MKTGSKMQSNPHMCLDDIPFMSKRFLSSNKSSKGNIAV